MIMEKLHISKPSELDGVLLPIREVHREDNDGNIVIYYCIDAEITYSGKYSKRPVFTFDKSNPRPLSFLFNCGGETKALFYLLIVPPVTGTVDRVQLQHKLNVSCDATPDKPLLDFNC